MPEKIVATSDDTKPNGAYYRIEYGPDNTEMAGTFPTVTEAVAFAKAYAGLTWRVIECTRGREN